jgi:hypothetical protein
MPQNQARLCPGAPVIHMQVGAADRAGCDPNNHVGRVLDGGIGDIMHTDPPGVFIDHGFHQAAPCARERRI